MQKRGKKYLFYGLNAMAIIFLTCLIGQIIFFLDAVGSAFPNLDEWRFQNNHSFIKTIFALNNENFQLFTNATFWLAPRIGFPFWGLRYFSLALLLVTLFTLYRLLNKEIPFNRRWLLILTFSPAFSFYMSGNLLWSVLSQTWFYFLFTFLAIKYGFAKPQTPHNQIITLMMGIAACFAMNISLPFLFALLYGLKAHFLSPKISKKNFYGQLLVSIIILIMVFGLYIHIRHHDDTEFSFMTLLSADYWLWLSYSLLGVWSGFLVSADNIWFYYIGGAFMLFWLLFLFCRQIHHPETYPLWATALIILGGMAMIVLFRGEGALSINTHSARYILYGVCLIPIIYALGATDKNIIVRCTADILLVIMLVCSFPSLDMSKNGGIIHYGQGDACLMSHLDIQNNREPFSCGRGWTDLRAPYQWFVTHDAAFKHAYRKNPADNTYSYNGMTFYKIPGKKVLLFR